MAWRVLVVLLCLCFSSVAAAQAKPPKVLIIFDTSNSMLWDLAGNSTYGDGSVDYPGVDTNGDGRANDSRIYLAKEALRDILEDQQVEVEFGLMRFYQEEGQGILPAEADWYQAPINYRGRDNCLNDGQVLVNIGPNSRPEIIRWIDQRESWPNDKELRGAGNTPLAQAITGAQSYFASQVIPNDPDRDCRSYYVLLVADGEQYCPGIGGDPGAAAFGLRELTFTLHGQFKIKTWVVGLGPEAAGAEQLNQIARAGGTAVNSQGDTDLLFGTALFASHPQQLSSVLRQVLRAIVPDEICDDQDNDCDGLIDEGFAQKGESCADGTGPCASTGVYTCGLGGDLVCDRQQAPGTDELCDGQDNDCDGEVDEGTRSACGLCGPPPAEVCDNLDNDCDGVVDNVACPEANDACVNGECAQPCQAGECFNGTVCRDGYCVTPCSNARCAPWVCQGGQCVDPCVGVQCPQGLACYQGQCASATCEVVGCPQGQVCRNSACIEDPCSFADCGPSQGCRDGICIDTCLGVECPPEASCRFGVCIEEPCSGVECPLDARCQDGRCVEDPCAAMTCQAGQICVQGACVEDACRRTTCPSGTWCVEGECVVGEAPIPEEDRQPRGDQGAGGGVKPPQDDSAALAGKEACSCSSLGGGAPKLPVAAYLALAGALGWLSRRRKS